MAADPRPGLRYEVKLVGDRALDVEVAAAFALHPAGIRPLHPTRVVQSLYLDTEDDAALEENLAGTSLRAKLRLRWYGAGAGSVRARMERKVRENSQGWKDVVDLGEPFEIGERLGVDLVGDLRRRLPAEWGERLHGRVLSQWVRYRRDYHTTFDGRVRITVDRDLAAADLRTVARPSEAVFDELPRALVVECKAAPEHWDDLEAVVGRLPLAVDKCSKFVMAASREEGPLSSVAPR